MKFVIALVSLTNGEPTEIHVVSTPFADLAGCDAVNALQSVDPSREFICMAENRAEAIRILIEG